MNHGKGGRRRHGIRWKICQTPVSGEKFSLCLGFLSGCGRNFDDSFMPRNFNWRLLSSGDPRAGKIFVLFTRKSLLIKFNVAILADGCEIVAATLTNTRFENFKSLRFLRTRQASVLACRQTLEDWREFRNWKLFSNESDLKGNERKTFASGDERESPQSFPRFIFDARKRWCKKTPLEIERREHR